MSQAGWGHWPEDESRHIIQVNRNHPRQARRFCRRSLVLDSACIVPGGDRSDLPSCGRCNTPQGRRQAGPPPAPRQGWRATSIHQARLT